MVVDGAPGMADNIGPRPMELILMGLGSCASFDVITILKKQRQDITVRVPILNVRIQCRQCLKITMDFHVSGDNLDQRAGRRYPQKNIVPHQKC